MEYIPIGNKKQAKQETKLSKTSKGESNNESKDPKQLKKEYEQSQNKYYKFIESHDFRSPEAE
jgi:hypothetical protein